MPTSPEATRHNNLTKLLVLLPLRANSKRTFQCETPCRYLGSSLGWQLDFRELQQIMQKSGNFLHPPPPPPPPQPPMKTESFCTLWQPAPACSTLKLRTSIIYTRSYSHTSVCQNAIIRKCHCSVLNGPVLILIGWTISKVRNSSRTGFPVDCRMKCTNQKFSVLRSQAIAQVLCTSYRLGPACHARCMMVVLAGFHTTTTRSFIFYEYRPPAVRFQNATF